jgi:hypothetical protein
MNASRCTIAADSVFLRGRPDSSAEVLTELLHGEDVAVAFRRADWAEVESLTDSYRGFVPTGAVGEIAADPTHCVWALRSLVYPEPNVKAPPFAAFSFLSRTRPISERNGFAARHLAPADAVEPAYWRTALRFLEVPYLWGGRTASGLDCSALVQLSLAAARIAAPRDSGPQRAALGKLVLGDVAPRPGDLAFWPGHVGIVAEDAMLVHANAYHMAVATEPLAAANARIGSAAEIRRL